MTHRALLCFLLLAPCSMLAAAEPLRALLITGGCCHDYAKQHEVIAKGIQSRANVQVDVIWTDDKSTNPPLPVYDKADWAKGYDIIIHDECAASMNNKETLTRILDAHKTIPSIQLHCAMHSFRTGEDRWFKRLGLQSNSHGPQEPIAITFVDKEHPITKTLGDWTTIKEELYNNVNLFDAHPLAMGKQTVKNKDGSTKDVEYIVAWTNEKDGARSFSTTIGHNTETVADSRYLDLITRGLLWACDKLTPEFLTPFTGQNSVTFVPAKAAAPPISNSKSPISNWVKASASSEAYEKGGNIAPKIVKLTPDQEAAILKDVKVQDGFEVSLFANSAAANYPVFVAAEPDGTLYVSSDGNGSVERRPKRGRVIRLRDLDGDGRADETKVFCEVDAPRGLVWDHDRLYLVHPPHLSEFIDADHDGVAEKENILVKDIAFGYKDRPADHTTNGLSLGIDGWLYIAGGDFGFMKATGTDGRPLQHRGGGVIRVRPDGTGLEIYSTGTRNILEVAISPLMDVFARDNTNDGGGWNVRFHHFTGLDDHGYPRLYKNFNDECIQPLADYGGGSGTGAVYIDEPGFGAWNNAPFTCDWGSGALWHHQVKPKGATFEETRKPEPFIQMTRPTDADVDGLSRVYCASWKGATFDWAGPDVGYIVQVKPKGWKLKSNPGLQPAQTSGGSPASADQSGLKPETTLWIDPLPDFAKAKDEELVKVLDLTQPQSYRRRIEAQRELLRRGNKLAASYLGFYEKLRTPERNSIDLIRQEAAKKSNMDYVFETLWSKDEALAHTSIRALATHHQPLYLLDAFHNNATGTKGDSTDLWTQRLLKALAMMHQPEVVTGLIERLGKATDPALRQGILGALSRLHFKEGEWKGDSWGTRPDTRGPYYQPEAWSETPKIAVALKDALAKASPEEAAFLVKELNRNRIQFNEAQQRILELAKKDPKVLPELAAQMAGAEEIPAEAVPLLVGLLKSGAAVPAASDQTGRLNHITLSQAIIALSKTDSADGVSATLAALEPLKTLPDSGKDYDVAFNAFLNAPKLENHHQLVEQIAENGEWPVSMYANAALLNLANRKTGSPESIQLTQKALDKGWADPKHRKLIIDAISASKHMASASKVLAALDDADAEVKGAAERAAKAMRIEKIDDKTPKLMTLKPEEALAAVLKEKGNVALGEQIFTKATCVACHTVKESEAQKGPYLGNIAQTYKRPDLAQNILDPNKTIAQGFSSEMITMKDGSAQMGFITLEGANEIKLRNIAAQEFTFKTADIKERQKLPMSIMPPGLMMNFTVKEFASLLDYLETLARK